MIRHQVFSGVRRAVRPSVVEGYTYDFAFGLNWAGVIADARTAAYGKATDDRSRRSETLNEDRP